MKTRYKRRRQPSPASLLFDRDYVESVYPNGGFVYIHPPLEVPPIGFESAAAELVDIARRNDGVVVLEQRRPNSPAILAFGEKLVKAGIEALQKLAR